MPAAPPAGVRARSVPLRMSTVRIVLLAALGLSLLSAAVFAATEALRSTASERVVLEPGIERIVVRTDGGEVDIRGGLTDSVVVRRTDQWLVARPDIDQSVRDGVLEIASRCTGLAELLRCTSDLEIIAPPEADIDVEVAAGDVTLRGLRGRVAVKTALGDVEARRLDPFTLRARSDAGDVTLDLVGTPTLVDAAVQSGSVSIVVPFGSYRVDAEAESGDVDVQGVIRDDLAPQRIVAAADRGDVSVRAR